MQTSSAAGRMGAADHPAGRDAGGTAPLAGRHRKSVCPLGFYRQHVL